MNRFIFHAGQLIQTARLIGAYDRGTYTSMSIRGREICLFIGYINDIVENDALVLFGERLISVDSRQLREVK